MYTLQRNTVGKTIKSFFNYFYIKSVYCISFEVVSLFANISKKDIVQTIINLVPINRLQKKT